MIESLYAHGLGRLALRVGQRLLIGIAAAAAVVVLFQFVEVVLARISYPFDLEWMESGIIAHVRRIAAGRPLYAEPSLEFTAFIYPPFYYYVSALVSSVVGLGHFAVFLVATFLGALFGNPEAGLVWLLFLGVSQLAHVVPLAIWMSVKNQLRTVKGIGIGAGITALLSAACWGVGMATFRGG